MTGVKATCPGVNVWPVSLPNYPAQLTLNCWTRTVQDSKLPLTRWLATTNLLAGHSHHGLRAAQFLPQPRLSSRARRLEIAHKIYRATFCRTNPRKWTAARDGRSLTKREAYRTLGGLKEKG
jgi:hypothetical protein